MTPEPPDRPPRPRLPAHLKRRIPPAGRSAAVREILQSCRLNTVCRSARCPNQGECFASGTATFMILGSACTRNCRFCAVPEDQAPPPPDADEPARLAEAAGKLALRYVVVTSVTRDDLPDGGAGHFAATAAALRALEPRPAVELLIPDFQGDAAALETVLASGVDVLNHNVETVPALYGSVRPQAIYARSLELLRRVSSRRPRVVVKSGVMAGLGETPEQMLALFDDLREAGCDCLTIGQYLSPGGDRLAVAEFVSPERFAWYREEALSRGFTDVASGPFVRSSYQAQRMFEAFQEELESR